MAKHFSTSLIASGKTWDEIVADMSGTGYTGTTWMVYSDQIGVSPDYVARLFTDLDEAKRFATSLTKEQVVEIFGSDCDDAQMRVEEDRWENGEYIEIGFCTWYGFDWTDDGWVQSV